MGYEVAILCFLQYGRGGMLYFSCHKYELCVLITHEKSAPSIMAHSFLWIRYRDYSFVICDIILSSVKSKMRISALSTSLPNCATSSFVPARYASLQRQDFALFLSTW